MRTFRINVQADRYPTEYVVEATGAATAVSRAMRDWKKRFKGSRATEWTVRIVAGAKHEKKPTQ